MAEFTASPDVSGFAPQNALFNLPADIQAGQTIQQNQLLNQGKQIDLANANMAQVGQAAAGLLSAYPDEPSRAAAYPKVVGMLQAQGVAMNAPATYPGEGALRAIVNASIPAKDLYSSGALLTPAQQVALGQTGQTGTTGTSTTGAAAPSSVPIPARGTGGPGASASAPPEWLPYYEEASKATGIPVDLLIAQTRQESGFNPNAKGAAGEVGLFQIKPSTAQSPGFGMQGVDPASLTGPDNVRNNIMFGAQYLRARMGGGDPTNPAVQAAGLHAYNGGGDPNYVANVFRYRPTLAPSDPNAAVTAYTPPTAGATTATAAPTAAQPGQPVPTQVAGPPMVSTAPAASTAAPGGPPAAQQFTYPNGKVGGAPDAQGGVQYGDGSYGTPPPGRPVPVAAATPAPAQPSAAQPGQPQGPATAPAAAPGGTAQLPDASTIPTGRNSPAWQQAQQLIDKGLQLQRVAGSNAGMRAQAQALIAEGTREQGLDSEVPAQLNGRPGNLNTNTGAFTYASPLPSPRFTGGAAVYNKTTGGWDQPTPATQADAVQGHWGVSGSGAPQFFPDATTPAEGGYKNMETAYKRNSEAIGGIAAEGRTAQADQVRVQEMRNILKTADTGSGTETQAAIQGWMQRWAPQALTNWTTNYANLQGPAAIQMFQKLGFMGATSQEQQTTPRGGYLATKLFQQFNPGAQLLTATNNGLLAQRLISNQAGIDYSQGALNHFTQQEQNFTSSKPSYSSLEQYDQQWQNQRNPQVYAAAIGALGQQDYTQWSKNLSQPEIERTLDVVHRADPSAAVNGKGGRLDLSNKGQPQEQTSAAPAVGTVKQGYRFTGGDPSNQANWARVQ